MRGAPFRYPPSTVHLVLGGEWRGRGGRERGVSGGGDHAPFGEAIRTAWEVVSPRRPVMKEGEHAGQRRGSQGGVSQGWPQNDNFLEPSKPSFEVYQPPHSLQNLYGYD